MLEDFKTFIKKNHLFNADDSILLAVSGGMDSMVMCDLFQKAGFSFGIAHCNFSLRGNESDEDESFVREAARKMKVKFTSQRFSTREYALEKGISIQMAARELRYDWFQKIIASQGFEYTATAHHLDDQIETFFINLTRQTGIAGFHGILPRKNNLIRPMLFCGRDKIASYAASHKIEYREDSSNQETKYLRNRIRHEIIPVLRDIRPEITEIINGNIRKIREAEIIFRQHIEQERKDTVLYQKDKILIPIEKLKQLTPVHTYLFEFLCPYGFNETAADEIIESIDHDPGSTWFSSTHRLIKDRQELIITKMVSEKEDQEILIPVAAKKITRPVHLTFSTLLRNHDFEISGSPEIASLDFHKLTFPLILRKWRKGDVFHPYGSGHRKKLSDFFTDKKLSLADKENIWLICSGDDIVWVIGHRIDHRFRITSSTKEVYMIRYRD